MVTRELLEDIKSGKIDIIKRVKEKLELIKKENPKINALLYIAEDEALKKAEEVSKKVKEGSAGKLAGLIFSIKSNINVIGMPISCASMTLEDYRGTYDADVIRKIKAEDGIILGMTNNDEFACGISGQTSAFGSTMNPSAPEFIPGGSSSGSAASVAAGFVDISLASDTGGSIRNPSSHCGVVGIKPSYGRVSRYGLIDLSMSLDQIGPLCKDIYGAALVMEVISGYSDNDPTTYHKKTEEYSEFKKVEGITLGFNKEFEELCRNRELHDLVMTKAREIANRLSLPAKEVDLRYTKLGVQTYYPIVYTEFFSATRRFDGRKYGKKIEDSCGEEVLRRILGGKEISRAEHEGAYYRKALKTKSLIKRDFDAAFQKVDLIIAPVTPDLPHKIDSTLSPEDAYAMDAFTIPANLAGICAGVVPIGKIDGVPVGMQVMAPAFKEKLMFNFMKAVEEME